MGQLANICGQMDQYIEAMVQGLPENSLFIIYTLRKSPNNQDINMAMDIQMCVKKKKLWA